MIFRRATISDANAIWNILEQAIERRKLERSNQWQDGYPNIDVVKSDIKKSVAYVLLEGSVIVGYTAILINDEPEYEKLQGTWLSNGDYVVFHRVAISEDYLGRGYANQLMKQIEKFALAQNIFSIKADTNFDNTAMLRIFKKFNYSYCGTVYLRNSPRRAYEKVLI